MKIQNRKIKNKKEGNGANIFIYFVLYSLYTEAGSGV